MPPPQARPEGWSLEATGGCSLEEATGGGRFPRPNLRPPSWCSLLVAVLEAEDSLMLVLVSQSWCSLLVLVLVAAGLSTKLLLMTCSKSTMGMLAAASLSAALWPAADLSARLELLLLADLVLVAMGLLARLPL